MSTHGRATSSKTTTTRRSRRRRSRRSAEDLDEDDLAVDEDLDDDLAVDDARSRSTSRSTSMPSTPRRDRRRAKTEAAEPAEESTTTTTRRRRPRRGAAPRRRRGAARRAAAGAHRQPRRSRTRRRRSRTRRPSLDERGDGPTQIVPAPARRVPLLVVLPRAAAQPARGREADALPRLRLSRATRRARPRALVPSARAVALGRARSASRSRRSTAGPLVARRARPAAVGVARCAAPGRAALVRLRLRRRVLRRSCSSGRGTSGRRDRPARRRRARPTSPAPGALVALVRPARPARRPGSSAAVWVVVEALRGRWPLGGLPVGRARRRRCTTSRRHARSRAGAASRSSRSSSSSCNALLVDLAARAASERRPARRGAGRGARWVWPSLVAVTLVVDVTRFEPDPDRAAPGRAPAGQRPEPRADRRRDRDRRSCPASHLALADAARGPVRPHRVPGVVRSSDRPASSTARCGRGSSTSRRRTTPTCS